MVAINRNFATEQPADRRSNCVFHANLPLFHLTSLLKFIVPMHHGDEGKEVVTNIQPNPTDTEQKLDHL